MVENAPSSVDLQEFQFKLHSKLKIFENTDDSKFKNAYNLVAAASRFGLVFVGSPNGTVEVIQLKSIENSSVTKVESSSFPKRSVPLPAVPSHLTLNCDQTLLAVICYKNGCALAIVYNVTSFLSQNVVAVREIRVSATPGVAVLEAGWNPTVPGVLTACKADGSLGVYNITETGVEINELPVAAAARCFCWSPKGKQLVVGSTNGSLTQYKPDLKAVKVVPAPALGNAGPYCALSVCWVSNYQFVAIYRALGNEEARPSIVMVNAPKTGPTTYINYDDICYSNGALRPPQYYIIHQSAWGVMIMASANSMEVGVLGVSSAGEPALWQQWNQIDAARAELPLSPAHQETFPVGVALDTGVTTQLPWGENQTLPAMPLIHLLSHHGVLCSFSVINIRPGAATVCAPPEAVADLSGLGMFQQPVAPPPQPAPVQQPPKLMSQPAAAVHQLAAAVVQQPAAAAPQPAAVAPQQGVPAPQLAASMSQLQAAIQAQPKPQPAPIASMQPMFGAASTAPTFGSLPPPQPTFGSLASLPPPQPTFSSPASLPPPTSAPIAPTPSTAPPGSLLGWTAGSTLFGSGTPPSFGGLASTPPASTMFNMAPPTARVTPTTAALGGGSPSMFGGGGGIKPPPPSAAAPTAAPMFAASSKPAAPVYTPPVSKPLLSTPKQAIKPVAPPQNETVTPKKDESVINDQIMQGLIKEEVKNFHSELQELFKRCKNIKLDVGTEEEKTNLVITTESLLEFHKELQDTTDSQVAEVHYLKQALMQSFAWYEDTRARHRRYTDPNFSNMLQSQELDPVSEKQLADIKHLIYYIEAQLKQVDSFLDNQWADFQDSCKKHVKGRLQIPTLEPIYQALVRQNAILDRHKYLLKDIAARIKSRNKKSSAYPNVMNHNLNNLTDHNIEIDEQLRKLKLDHGDLFAARYDKILAQENKFNEVKQTKLCAFFTNRNVVHIAPKKPKFINTPSKFNSFIASPAVQRNLAQAFEKIDVSFNNSAVEANLSASNLFSFTLLDGHSTKASSPEKQFHTLKSPEVSNKPTAAKVATNLFNLPSTSPVFNFSASSTSVTQSKPTGVLFTSSDTPMFAGASSNVKSTPPGTKFVLTPQPKSAEAPVSKQTTQPTSNQSFTFISPKPATTNIPASVPKLAADSSAISAASSNIIPSKPDTTLFAGPRDSIGPNFNFGTALSLGQQSTPKPKSPAALNFAQPTTTSVSAPKSTITTTAATQIVVPKPTFGLASGTSASSPAVKSEPVVPSSAPGIFGGLAGNKPSTPGTFFSSQPTTTSEFIFGASSKPVQQSVTATTSSLVSAAATTTTSSGFSLPQAAAAGDAAKPASIFGGINASLFAASVGTTSPASSAASGGFGFLQQAATATTNTAVTTSSSTPPTSSAAGSGFNFLQQAATATATSPAVTTSSSTPPTSSAANSGFGFLQQAATTSSAVTTSSSTPPTSSAASSGFSFLQQAATPTAASTAVTTSSSTPPTSSAASGSFSFLQQAATGAATSTAVTTSSSTPPTSSAATSGFGFLQQAATPTTTSTAVTTSPITLPTSSAISSGFSFLQQAASAASTTSTSSTPTTTPKITSVFSVAPAENKPAEPPTTVAATTTGFGNVHTTESSSFGFAALAAAVSTATADNKFSFGNLTVSALSPSSAPTTSPAPSTTTATGFSFALTTVATTTTSTTTTASAFGGFGSSIFGKPAAATTTTASSFIGQPICSPSSFTQPQNSGSIFGQSTGNIFAQKPTTTATTGSIFGQQSSGGSLFGQTAASPAVTSASAASIFGQTQSSPFGSPVASTTATTGGSIFGQVSSSSGSIFGQQSSFGNPAATSASSSFSFTQTTSGFGTSGGSIFGAKPSFGSAPAPAQGFGQPAAFGAPPAFGGTPAGGSVFGSPAPAASNAAGSTFGGGFGSPSSFGQKPTFGSPPSFGQSAFGSPPAFGGSPSFGSPQRVFGSTNNTPPTGTFGSTSQENSTFANLATQPTLGFGSLVQNQPPAQQPQPPQFSGGAQFSSWR